MSDFCRRSGGYPTPFLFRICGYGKVIQSLVSTIVQIVVLAISSSGSGQCGVIIIVAISSSIIVLVMTVFEILFQSGSLSDSTTSSNTNNDSIRSNNDTDIEISNNIRRISITTNPIIKEEGK